MPTQKKQLWLRANTHGFISLYRSVNKPTKRYLPGYIDNFCPKIFKSITGISLKPGEVVGVKTIRFELENK